MKKENLTEEQLIFQDAVRTFFEREVTPNNEQWEKDGQVSREVWLKAGENNFFGIQVKTYRSITSPNLNGETLTAAALSGDVGIAELQTFVQPLAHEI